MTVAKCNWPISDSENLEFEIYPKNEGWNAVAGLYIFAFEAEGYWRALYVGQTDNFQIRLPNHDRIQEAVRNGATHIHAKAVAQQNWRDYWEKALVQRLQPPMNVQLR